MCPVCTNEISAAAYKAKKERKLFEQMQKEKARIANEKWLEELAQRKEREKKERQEKRVLEKAAYEVLKEMGILDQLKAKEKKNGKIESRKDRSQTAIVGKI